MGRTVFVSAEALSYSICVGAGRAGGNRAHSSALPLQPNLPRQAHRPPECPR